MSRKPTWITCALTLCFAIAANGCGATGKSEPNPTRRPAADTKIEQPAETAAEAVSAPGLKELSQADRELAEKQKICPVSGEPLGSMGTPVKLTVKGQVVFLCCAGCKAEFNKHPDKYLKKINDAK